jgi:hypothetical protein
VAAGVNVFKRISSSMTIWQITLSALLQTFLDKFITVGVSTTPHILHNLPIGPIS